MDTQGRRYRDCGDRTRRLVAIRVDDDIRPSWCPGGHQRCDTTTGDHPCPHNAAWFGQPGGAVTICCHYGLEPDDGGGRWGVPGVPGGVLRLSDNVIREVGVS
jgi:hypothetical protein